LAQREPHPARSTSSPGAGFNSMAPTAISLLLGMRSLRGFRTCQSQFNAVGSLCLHADLHDPGISSSQCIANLLSAFHALLAFGQVTEQPCRLCFGERSPEITFEILWCAMPSGVGQHLGPPSLGCGAASSGGSKNCITISWRIRAFTFTVQSER